MSKKINIDVCLDDEQYNTLKRLARNDHMNIVEEARLLFYLQLREEIWLAEARERGEQ